MSGKTLKNKKAIIKEYLETIIIAFALAMFIRTFIVSAYKIPSDSMLPTLQSKPINDRIMVNKFIYKFHQPKRGDIIVFRPPWSPKKNFIKRVIAFSGEEVEIKNGSIYIDGLEISQPKEIANTYYYPAGSYGQGPIIIPSGHIYLLGDNSSNSQDSRYEGFVPMNKVVGKAMFIFWPPYRIKKVR